MSLEQKLSSLTKNIEDKKNQEIKSLEEKELGPIRSKIKELEDKKYLLELIKGSLNLKSGERIMSDNYNKYTGVGMSEYSNETKVNLEKEITKLDNLIIKNKEALESLGINNRQELVDNFKDDPDATEVHSYLDAENKKIDLNKSDESLKEKLKNLGFEINDKEFSYESAEKGIEKNLGSLENDIYQEKLKTPEGKKEAIESLSLELEKLLPTTELVKDSFGNYQIPFHSRSNNGNGIKILGEEAKLNKGEYFYLLPDFYSFPDGRKLSDIESKYGEEVIEGAIKKAYFNKVEKSFGEFSKSKDGDYFANKHKNIDTIKNNVHKKIEEMVDFGLKIVEINKEVKNQNFCPNHTYLEQELSKIEENKKDAIALMNEITRIESDLSGEDLTLNGVTINVLSVDKEIEEQNNKIKKEEINLKNKDDERHNRKKGFFETEKKWRDDLHILDEDFNKLKSKIEKMGREEMNELYKRYYIYIPTKDYSDTKRIVESQQNIKGKSDEIFKDLKLKLAEVIDKKAPESIVKLNKEYKEIQEKLYS
jgi:hypothetical protein